MKKYILIFRYVYLYTFIILNENLFIDDFSPAEKPKVTEEVINVPLHKRKLPPWNGYGSFEDSAQNCVTVEPKQIFRDVKKFLKYDR